MKHLNRIWLGMLGVLFVALMMLIVFAVVYGMSSDVLEYQISSCVFLVIVFAYALGFIFEKEGEYNQETI